LWTGSLSVCFRTAGASGTAVGGLGVPRTGAAPSKTGFGAIGTWRVRLQALFRSLARLLRGLLGSSTSSILGSALTKGLHTLSCFQLIPVGCGCELLMLSFRECSGLFTEFSGVYSLVIMRSADE